MKIPKMHRLVFIIIAAVITFAFGVSARVVWNASGIREWWEERNSTFYSPEASKHLLNQPLTKEEQERIDRQRKESWEMHLKRVAELERKGKEAAKSQTESPPQQK